MGKMKLKVATGVKYLAGSYGDASSWASATCALVKFAKGEPCNAHATVVNEKGEEHKVDSGNISEKFEELVTYVATDTVPKIHSGKFVLVPVPNSDMTVDSGWSHRIIDISQKIAGSSNHCRGVLAILRWAKVKKRAHRDGARLNCYEYQGMLRVEGSTDMPIVLFDDVITTGSQMAGAYRSLVAAGMKVVGGIALAKTIHSDDGKMNEGLIEEVDADPDATRKIAMDRLKTLFKKHEGNASFFSSKPT